MFTETSFKLMCDKAGLRIVKLFGELPVIDLMYDFISYSEELVEAIVRDNESYRSTYILKHKTK